jgi:hypothetical protein
MIKTYSVRKINSYNSVPTKKSSDGIGLDSSTDYLGSNKESFLGRSEMDITVINPLESDFGKYTRRWSEPEVYKSQWSQIRSIELKQSRAWNKRVNLAKNVAVIQYIYVSIGETKFSIPVKFEDLANEIKRSSYILELPDNWDDEGSKSYKQETLIFAINFLLDYFYLLDRIYAHSIKVPQISHGVNGGIDILWKSEDYRLLINIHEAPSNIASFFGDDYKDNKIKGTFNPAIKNYGLISSLLSYK